MTREEIKQFVSMRQVLEERGIKVNRSGFCCCPFHGDKKPSMKVYRNSVYCFSSCNRSWDLFGFVMEYDGVDFPTAFQSLGGTYEKMTPSKQKELDELERKRKRARQNEIAWKQQKLSESMLVHANRELARKQEQPYLDENGEAVFPEDWCYFMWHYWKHENKLSEMEEEGRKNGWS